MKIGQMVQKAQHNLRIYKVLKLNKSEQKCLKLSGDPVLDNISEFNKNSSFWFDRLDQGQANSLKSIVFAILRIKLCSWFANYRSAGSGFCDGSGIWQ